jgi:hypothetical protein
MNAPSFKRRACAITGKRHSPRQRFSSDARIEGTVSRAESGETDGIFVVVLRESSLIGLRSLATGLGAA